MVKGEHSLTTVLLSSADSSATVVGGHDKGGYRASLAHPTWLSDDLTISESYFETSRNQPVGKLNKRGT